MEETAVADIQLKEHKFPCKQCGAELVFAPEVRDLKCPFCGYVENIPESPEAIKEYSFNDYLAQPRSKGYGKSAGREMRCERCGAVALLDSSVRASSCAFCGSPMIQGDDKASEDVISPEAIVPFVVTSEQAQASFRKWISSLWFAPGALKTENNLRQMQGVYRPFWTYDSHTVSHWTGERGDHYYVTERRGKETRSVRKTRWTSVSGTYREFFDDVLIGAGKDTELKTSYKLAALTQYKPEFLSGFAAERYSVSCEHGWARAKDVIKDLIYSAVRNRIGGDEQRVHSVDTAYSGITYKHVLLPLWLSCYRYKEKTYCFQVNGQTGEVAGARPYSFWKIFLLVLAILAVIGIVALIVNAQ